MSEKQIEILKTLGEYKEGQIITVAVDKDGVVLSRFWRRRIKEAKSDGFCRILEPKKAEPEVKKQSASLKKDRDNQLDEG